MTATGGFGTVVDFLRTVKQPLGKIGGRPVVVDPLEVTGEQVQMTVLVPYVVGKADSRSPAPPRALALLQAGASARPPSPPPASVMHNHACAEHQEPIDSSMNGRRCGCPHPSLGL